MSGAISVIHLYNFCFLLYIYLYDVDRNNFTKHVISRSEIYGLHWKVLHSSIGRNQLCQALREFPPCHQRVNTGILPQTTSAHERNLSKVLKTTICNNPNSSLNPTPTPCGVFMKTYEPHKPISASFTSQIVGTSIPSYFLHVHSIALIFRLNVTLLSCPFLKTRTYTFIKTVKVSF